MKNNTCLESGVDRSVKIYSTNLFDAAFTYYTLMIVLLLRKHALSFCATRNNLFNNNTSM